MSETDTTDKKQEENSNMVQSMKLKNEIDELKRKQLQIMELKFRSQTEHHQEEISIHKHKMQQLLAQKKILDHDILMRTAQLDAVKHELQTRDQHNLQNLDHLLSSARVKLLEAQLNDAEYYQTSADKLALVQQNVNADERKNILVQQRKAQFEREQRVFSETLQHLQNDKNDIVLKLELLRTRDAVEDEKAETEESVSTLAALPSTVGDDAMESIKENISKLKNELSASEEHYRNEQNSNSNMLGRLPTRYNQTVLAEKQTHIASETLALDTEIQLLLRKQKQHQLIAVCSEVIWQLIDEHIKQTICAIFDEFKDLYRYAQQMTHEVLLSSIVGGGSSMSSSSTHELCTKCLQQLQHDREHQQRRPRFTLRHLCIDDDDRNNQLDIMTEKKKLYARFAHDDIAVLFCFESYSPFMHPDWLEKEQTFWQQHICMDVNRLSAIETVSHRRVHYSHIISSNDGRFVVCGTDNGHLFIYNIAVKSVVASTIIHPDTKRARNSNKGDSATAAAITMIQIADNNQQIVCLQANGIALVYNVQHNRILKHSQIEYQHKVTHVAFHSHLLVNGTHTSVMLGLETGTIIKWNLDADNKNPTTSTVLLYGHRIHEDIKQCEQFEGHCDEICFIGFVDKLSDTMLTCDVSGLICVWRYERDYVTAYGWFAPKHRFYIDCDSFAKTRLQDDEHGDTVAQRLYDANTSHHHEDATQYESRIKRTVLSQQTHVCCQYQRNNSSNRNGNNLVYFMPVAAHLDCRYRTQSDAFLMDILAYSSTGNLVCHYQQKYVQKRLRGKIISAKFCSNYRDLIVAIVLHDVRNDIDKNDTQLKIIQFRLLRYEAAADRDDDGDGEINIDPHFMVNTKQSSVDDWPVYDVSPVLVPPCSDYLYVLMGNSLSIYSIYTSQKVYSRSSLLDDHGMSNLRRNNQFCVSKDHAYIVYANNSIVERHVQQRRNNKDYCTAFHKIVHHSQTSAISAWRCELRKSQDYERVTRTPWRWRKQKRWFTAYNGDHYTHIKKIIQNVVENICS